MSKIFLVARDEWRYWGRSKLALWSTLLFAVLLVVTAVLTALRMEHERSERIHHQAEAEETFLSQPARHPHRMVHYGHYVFRAPSPLSLIDPGLDPVTGQSIFLEGHRQNSAMFADSSASADLGGLSWLTPALIYQLFGPLLLILLGHGAIVREREASTLVALQAQGVRGFDLVAGKALALASALLVLLLPLGVSALAAISMGESLIAAFALIAIYFLYLNIWSLLSLLISVLLQRRSSVLTGLTAVWLFSTLLMPALAVSNTTREFPLAGKIEVDLAMLEEVRKLGDGHNTEDPAFQKLRADLFNRYNVNKVEDLPVNLRGVVATEGEAKLTETMNEFADRRMAGELRQASLLNRHGWLTPTLAVARASRSVSGTALETHQRFLREAEAVRFDFVQGLNKVHAEELSYVDDINRNSSDPEVEKRSRVDATNWQVLDDFRFETASQELRIENASGSVLALTCWCLLLAAGSVLFGIRLKP